MLMNVVRKYWNKNECSDDKQVGGRAEITVFIRRGDEAIYSSRCISHQPEQIHGASIQTVFDEVCSQNGRSDMQASIRTISGSTWDHSTGSVNSVHIHTQQNSSFRVEAMSSTMSCK